jgi:predicted helicase
MCIIGNPPYSGISSNNGKWISDLIEDYKYVDGVHFNERKHWLNDDYVKFLRFGQHFIEKNGSGVLAFINPYGFLDNPTFRGMRWHLLKTFDKIYTIDLHGNSNIKEKHPDGSADINVFDIQQGVSINIFVKTGKKKNNQLGEVLHFDLFGKREDKYDFLIESSLSKISFKKLKPEKPYFFFKTINNNLYEVYNKGFFIASLFSKNSVGFVSANDGLNISFTKEEQQNKIRQLLVMDEPNWRIQFKRPTDARDWTYNTAKNDATNNANLANYKKVLYRPFDIRWTLYTGNSRGLYSSPQPKVMQQFLLVENIGLITARSNKSDTCDHFYISKNIMETKCGERTTQSAIFPLYLYQQTNAQQTIGKTGERTPNLNAEIVKEIAEKLELKFTNEKETTKNTFAPIDILDYIYAVLHSPTYREKYKEFLKIDFPRVPYPKDTATFWQLVKLGGEIRQIHLLESAIVDKYITQYPVDGDNVVSKPKYQDGKVYINDTQYFDNVPQVAWEFYIGGYQPAPKWLKDRKERTLEFDEILHYQKIIVALSETDRLMKEIDKIEI